ncbi:MAG: PIG-L deacetylase family protein, partial [Candidatus Bipolaricaulia bacterium]
MENQLEPGQGERVLIFAPHNDDEVLAAGGLIQRYVESDTQVKVAVITNGDGQIRRPPFLPFFRADFVKLGYKRQNETLDAMEYLGLGEDDVEFFGYPDRGLSHMWTNHWDLNEPYYSKYTKTDHSPYDNSYTGEAPYCGSAVAKDVRRLLLEYKPDVIYLPHPNDSHPDHWATNGFVLYGLEQLKNEGYKNFTDVTMLSYLVHSVRFPWPRGKYLESSLSEPEHLEGLDTEWVEVKLDMKERLRKFRAIGKYRTQTQLMRKYLISFARANELFGIVPSLS